MNIRKRYCFAPGVGIGTGISKMVKFHIKVLMRLASCMRTGLNVSLLNEGPLFKERICSSGSKFFPLRGDPHLQGPLSPGQQISKTSSSPL